MSKSTGYGDYAGLLMHYLYRRLRGYPYFALLYPNCHHYVMILTNSPYEAAISKVEKI
jgi:hypothetical protein